MNKKILYGCHDFLNSKPLLYPLLNNYIDHNFDIRLDTPSNLAKRLQDKEFDMAFIPSIEYLRTRDVVLVPDYSIASNGSVDSVILYTRKELKEIKTVAVDIKSSTSVALLRLLFKENLGVYIEIIPSLFDNSLADIKEDGGLIIGDKAFGLKDRGFNLYDLSTLWYELTEMPFVHAVVAVKKGISIDKGIDALYKARVIGIEMIDAIAKQESVKLNISESYIKEYLNKKIYYNLGKDELRSLKKFYDLAVKHNIAEGPCNIEFYSGL